MQYRLPHLPVMLDVTSDRDASELSLCAEPVAIAAVSGHALVGGQLFAADGEIRAVNPLVSKRATAAARQDQSAAPHQSHLARCQRTPGLPRAVRR
jgi:hypothetical protein